MSLSLPHNFDEAVKISHLSAYSLKGLLSGVDVWIAFPKSIKNPKLIEWYEGLLDEQERDQYNRFQFLEDQRSYLVAHSLLRTSLSCYASTRPGELRFQRTKHGRPDLVPGQHPEPIAFNLSHTRELTACIVSNINNVGIDVEALSAVTDFVALVPRVLSDHEQLCFNSLETDRARHQYFIEHWCLKESFTKAIGTGLGTDFCSLTFSRDTTNRIGLNIANRNIIEWRFLTYWPTSDHCLATAIPFTADGMPSYRILEVTPGNSLSCPKVLGFY